MNRLELLLSESTGRNAVLEEERRRAEAMAAETAATAAQAAAQAVGPPQPVIPAAQGASSSKPATDESRGTRGHSQPPHWRRRPDMARPQQELTHIEQQDKNKRQFEYLDVDQYYEHQQLQGDEHHYNNQYPPYHQSYNPNTYPYPEQYPQWNQYPHHHANPSYHVPLNPDPYNPPNPHYYPNTIPDWSYHYNPQPNH
jgi:hypothetical protein